MAQVADLQRLRGRRAGDRARVGDRAPVEHRHRAGVAHCMGSDLLDHDDGHAAGVQLAEHVVDLVDQDRREAERGFVHDDGAGLGHHGPAEGEHLLLAAGQGRGGAVQAVLHAQRHQLQGGIQPPLRLGAVAARAISAKHQVLPARQLTEQAAPLGHQHDALLDEGAAGQPGLHHAVDLDRAAGGRNDSAQDLRQRRLAGAVGSEDGRERARRHDQ